MRSEVPMALIIRTTAFWYVTSCNFLYWCQHFDETRCSLLQSRGSITSLLVPAIFLSITDRYIPCGLDFYPEDWGIIFLRNVDIYIRNYTVSHFIWNECLQKRSEAALWIEKKQQMIAKKLIEFFSPCNQTGVRWRCSSCCSCCWRCW